MKTFVWVTALCWLTIALDGYDLIVYGATVPTLLRDSAFGPLTPAQVGAIGSDALMGMLLGALTVGTLTDLVGRRRVMLGCITWFSLAMTLCALAPGPELLGLFRFLAGLGLGGVMPTASALTLEHAPSGRKDLIYAIMFSGYSVGGMLAAGLAIALLPVYGWRVMFAVGLVGVIIVLPLVARYLPESPSFAIARAEEMKEKPGHRDLAPLATLFSPSNVAATLLF